MFHATAVLEWNGKMIYNDPDDDTAYAATYLGLPKADLILVSHSHGDHFSASKIDAVRGPAAVIIAPQSVYNGLSPTASVQGLTVEAVPAYNANHPRPTCNGYVLTIGGKRLYFSGDTGDIPEMRTLSDIDVAFLCMNVPFTMTVDQAAAAVRVFRPRVVYPYHYRNQDGTFANLNRFKSLVGIDLGVEVRLRKWY
jgi:L-ascorbate metabolism protein UlaG (beta-lactamase superfamily)